MNAPAIRLQDDVHDWADLQRAVALLEAPTLTAKMANLVGSPLEFAVRKLPASVSSRIHSVTEAALYKAAQTALWSMDREQPGKTASPRLHKLAAAASGALGDWAGCLHWRWNCPCRRRSSCVRWPISPAAKGST